MKYRANCPYCGWLLMQVSPNSEVNIDCPKCKCRLSFKVEEYSLQVVTCGIGRESGAVKNKL